MIGAIVAMRFVGKKSWWESFVFWAVYLAVVGILTFMLMGIFPYLGMILGIGVFVALAHFWMKFPLNEAIWLLVTAFIIDIVITFILAGAVIAAIGAQWATTLMPTAQLVI